MKKKLYHQFACSSLMLPEHRTRLARHRERNTLERCRESAGPVDEQQLEQFQRLVERSMRSGLRLKATYIDGGGRCRSCTGVVRKGQPDPGRLRLQTGDGVLALPVSAIIRLESAP